MCHHIWEPTVLSRVSCRPFHLNVDRFHQPRLLPGRTSGIRGACRFPVPRGSSSFASYWRFWPRRLDGTAAGRVFSPSSFMRVPPEGRRCLHTRRFGTLAGPLPLVRSMSWGPHLPGHLATFQHCQASVFRWPTFVFLLRCF